ncbi:MAG: Nif3-like dinuclear metal center hexameric protein [Victivallaceae bacterium]
MKDLVNYLNVLLAESLFKDYCENGIQFGDPEQTINKIALGVTADLETIEKAVSLQADVLITHHGLFWKGEPQRIIGYKKIRIDRLSQANLSLVAYHLPLDAELTFGNNWKVAHDLGWQNPTAFGSDSPQLGVMGNVPQIPIEDFVSILERYYETSLKTAVLKGNKIVAKVSLLAGNGYREIVHSASLGCDCHITGSFDEPAWSLAKENKINFLAFGHSATEKVGIKGLMNHLNRDLNIPLVLIDTDNPF